MATLGGQALPDCPPPSHCGLGRMFSESWVPLPNGYYTQPGKLYDVDVETTL